MKKKQNIQLLVVDDHQVVREGLRHMLGLEEDIELIGQGANSEEALIQAELLSPDVILMDIKMPGVDGIELTRQIKQKHPDCNVIMLTLYDEYFTQAMEAGARGYLLKDIRRQELTEAIRKVHCGEVVVSKDIADKLKFAYDEGRSQRVTKGPVVMVEELQIVLPPPVDANQLMRFSGRAEENLDSRVLQVVGSWEEGTIVTVILDKSMALVDILKKLKELPEIEAVAETPVGGEISPKLLKKSATVPRLKNRTRKTIFVAFEKNGTH